MKSTLIGINASYTHTCLAVYAMYAASMHRSEIGVREFHINQPHEDVLAALYKEDSDIYLFSCYIWNIDFVLRIASDLKRIKHCRIALGGSEVAYTPSVFLEKYHFIDYVITGEGECTLDKFLEYAEHPNKKEKPTFVHVKNESEKTTAEVPVYDFAIRPFPYSEAWLREHLHQMIYYESSRGCPYRCSYCISQLEKTVRNVPIAQVKRELKFFMDHNVSLVKFVDRTFNADIKRAEEIVAFILKNNHETRFHFEICAELMSENLLDLFASAPTGWFQTEIGLQSTDPAVLRAVRRNFNAEKFSHAMQRLSERQNVHVHADLIAMLPEETIQTFAQGFDYLYRLQPHMLQLGFLKILRGTKIETDAERYGLRYSENPPYEVFSSDTMSFDEKIKLKQIAYLVEKLHNADVCPQTFASLLNETGDTPFELFGQLAAFYEDNGYFDRAISKKEHYKVMSEFISYLRFKSIESILLYDYLKCTSFQAPVFLKESTVAIAPQTVFAFLHTENAIETYLPAFTGMKPKEIVKHIQIVRFMNDPINRTDEPVTVLFTDEKEDTVRVHNRHVILPNDVFDFGV